MIPDYLRELEDALNAMGSDPAWKHKIIILPNPPSVQLQVYGNEAWLLCGCGWEYKIHEGNGMTGYSLDLLWNLSQHECTRGETE